jgi:hypothetical protein
MADQPQPSQQQAKPAGGQSKPVAPVEKRATYNCTICGPSTTFPTKEALDAHRNEMHATTVDSPVQPGPPSE